MSDDFQEVVFGGGLTVRVSREVAAAAEPVLAQLLADGVPAKLAAKDPTLWGPAAAAEAAVRLGWVDTFERSRALLPQLAELREELGDLDHVVLAGMGGSSLAPEVISLTLGKRLTVLDTTDPGQVAAALGDRLDRTVVVVSSKSGGTVETDSQRRAYLQAFLDAGLSPAEAGRHFVVVTDPGSPLESTAREMGAFVLLADADVGGRYSALTAFGLVPTALAGVDVAELLDQAEEFATTLTGDVDNPAFLLGAVLGAAARHGRDKLALVDDGSGITGLGDWAEQLIAESTGKDGKGILPVVVETPISAGATGPDVLTATIGGALGVGAVPGSGVVPHVSVNGALGAQFLCWEAATAVAGRVLGIDPFDQPNVTESKQNTNKILEAGLPAATPSFTEGAIIGYGDANSLEDALRALLGAAGGHGYLAVLAYLDRFADADAAKLREQLAAASGRPVTFGWGPRFLHSTGQYHKGGPQHGAFLQITGDVAEDLAVPGKPYTFGQLQAAQAAGDRQALAGRDRPLLHLHLTDRAKGIAQLLDAAGRLQPYKER
ncbi:glucose-6-phosphate isomerase [Catellatospora chokoriensis]|uniref:Glucose-6-phosphate isomerase n=1 Tax=Catellatospora chokoriensis TaxID=310353 RepID=A0A8J3JZR4_9ACTN|nr:glucose-6-phosphate isomerase [Catellatospora chokoriensis]GIF86734.1 glucose-6-phosphate isomerase [Catellatospora chokoriensis]